ncbi:MAG TPA: GH25 family lysozyme, partial [Flavobacterium sp.]|nr:GH25 family lysozyme [Flavobacterium sp.]
MATARRKLARRLPRRNKKTGFLARNAKTLSALLFFIIIFGAAYHYRNGLAYYFSFKTDKVLREQAEEKRLADVRNVEVLSKHELNVIGIDVSEYQGLIDWTKVDTVAPAREIGFVFIRATAGKDKVDSKFDANWQQAKDNNIIRGAYHYYRPNENSSEQADNFIATVKLSK